MELDFSRCRDVWVLDASKEAGGFWSPPFPHVKVGVKAIVKHPFYLLADDMGGAKTAQSIIAAQFLSEMNVIDRVIVVAPAAVRPKVWFDEDLGQLKEQFWVGKKNIVSEYHRRIKRWETEGTNELRWIVTNYEFIRRRANLDVLLQYCGPKTMLILDESSAVKSHASDQTAACMLLRWLAKTKSGKPALGFVRCGRILLLNGTPVADSPMDMFSQGNLMHPSILDCQFVTEYKARYAVQAPVLERGKPMMRYGKPVLTVESWTNLDDLQRRFAPYVMRREAKDFGVNFALPPVALTVTLKESWSVYKEMKNEMVAWLKSGVATARTAAVKGMRLAQITSGFVGGVEDEAIDEEVPDVWFDGFNAPMSKGELDRSLRTPAPAVQEVGREKLDFALEWHAELLTRYPNLKLLTWCRFLPELRRYLYEERLTFPAIPIGAACGASMFGQPVKAEREMALRLLHPKTAPAGPATVGATQGTGALGLNFTACRTVLDMSYDFSPWKKKQGDARVNRTGQTGPVSFFYLVAVGPKGQKTIDHHVMMTRLGKANINDMTTAAWVRALEE